MTSEWDGTPWGGTAVATPTKIETGPFVSHVNGTPLASLDRSPQRKMREAQAQYHTNPWVRTAEAVVTRKVVGLPWHLETPDDEEIADNAGGVEGEILRLLERPQAALENVGRKMTRRELWAITSRHIGLCGMAFWYLDQLGTDARTPLGIIYVNPARMWCVADEVGNLTGWVIDAKDQTGRGGTPLTTDEVLPFYLDPPDGGHYGSGLVEVAWQKAQITMLADRHAAYILATGGRLPGIVSPKEGTIPDEAFKTLVAEFRNVNEAPDAAKRTTVVRGPIDFTATAIDPSDLMLPQISTMNRDDILAVWGVPPTQAGIPAPAGLNSGATKGFDEAILMQGAVHDRVVAMRETIQYGLLDRYQRVGVTLDLEFEEPEFDDASPAYENAVRATNLPLTNAERRAIVGLDPTGDEAFDNAVVLPITLSVFDATVPVFPEAEPMSEPMKAASRFTGLRSRLEARFVPTLRRSVAAVLRAQMTHVASRVREQGEKLRRKPADTTIWWEPKVEDARLAKVLGAGSSGIATTVARQMALLLEPKTKAAPAAFEDRVAAHVRGQTGKRIVEINRTTRDAVQAAITQGFDDGLSPSQIGDLIESLPAFDEARAELVARTETMLAYNEAALSSYGEFGVTEVLAYDGDEDPECAARDGQTFSVEEAAGIEDHPNGTLDWSPVVGRAYEGAHEAKAEVGLMEAFSAGIRAIAPPIVNVAAPVVTVEAQPAPIVNVAAPPAPIVNVPPAAAPIVNVDMAPVAAMIGELRTLIGRPVVKEVMRDGEGRILRVIET